MEEEESKRVMKMPTDSGGLEDTDFQETKNELETGSYPMDSMAVDAHDFDEMTMGPPAAERLQVCSFRKPLEYWTRC